MGKIVFWICIICIVAYSCKNNAFDGIGNFFNMIKSDIEYQKSLVPSKPEEIDTQGIIEVEEEHKTVRRSGLGTVYGNR